MKTELWLSTHYCLQHSDFTEYGLCSLGYGYGLCDFFYSNSGVSDSMLKEVSEESFHEDNLRKEEEGKEEADENTSLLSGSKRYYVSVF